MNAIQTYGEIKLAQKDEQWVIQNLQPHVALRLKQLFPRIPKSSAGPFYLNNNTDVCADIKWFTSRYPLKIKEKDVAKLESRSDLFFEERSDVGRILLPNWKPSKRPGLKPGNNFRKYQLTALDFVEKVRSGVIVDAVGLGKTYEGLGIGLIPGNLPLVCVCEPHLQKQWLEKAEEFIDLKVHAVKGNTPYDLPEADIYIFKYTQLSPWVDVLTQGWIKAIIFDEVQQLRRGTESAKGTAAKQICDQVDTKFGLTATLIYNYGVEAFNLIEFFRPGLLGSRADFVREWCSDGERGVVSDPDALGAYLRESHFLLRRTKKDVGQESAQRQPEIIKVDISSEDVDEAEAIAEQLAMKTLTSDFTEAGMAARELDIHMRQMTGIAKAKGAAGAARLFLEADIPLLMFGWHRDVYKIWAEELGEFNPLFYTGSETAVQKEKNKAAFINGDSNLLIMSLRSGAGADGIQNRCSTVLISELDWSPNVHHQCIGRVDRDDPEEPVHVYYAVCDYGSDPVMMDTLGIKKSQSRGIQDPGKGGEIRQVDKGRLKLLAESYLKSRGVKAPKKNKSSSEDGAAQISLL